MNLIFENNIVTRTIAYIFINDECNGLEYKNAKERGETAYNLFKNILDFEEVTPLPNLEITEVIKKLDSLQKLADDFEEEVAQKHLRF